MEEQISQKPSALEPIEKKIGFILGLVGAIAFALIWVPIVQTKPQYWLVLLAGTLPGILMMFFARFWNRYALGIASFVIGFAPWPKQYILLFAVPFVGFSTWIFVRASRESRRQAVAQGKLPPPKSRESKRMSKRNSNNKKSNSTHPVTSKRYTPPKKK